jgi:basic membrane lipoprotein Med (substrate-binding protein (PBP1-ABC) superfamily)
MEKANKAPKNTHVIGAVGGISIPPVNHYIAGYKWAALKYDPTIKVLVGYSNDFNDPTKCKALANSQIGQKAEFIFQVAGGCGLGALQAAGDAKVYSFGVDADQKDANASVIASALKKVDVAVYNAIKSVVDKKFQGGETRFSLQNGATGYQVDNIDLPADIKTEVDSLAAKIKSGAETPPADIPASPTQRRRAAAPASDFPPCATSVAAWRSHSAQSSSPSSSAACSSRSPAPIRSPPIKAFYAEGLVPCAAAGRSPPCRSRTPSSI